MKPFVHITARSVDEAVSILNKYEGGAKIIAGGTDLLGQIKNRIHTMTPDCLVDIKSIPDLEYIKEDEEGLKIGSLTKLRDIASQPIIKEKYSALAQAAYAVGSPHLRVMGTIGGNLCQDIRCWYYRAPKNYFPCLRKKGTKSKPLCYAVAGDNRYHSILGAVYKCIAVNPGDTAPALIVLKAKIRTTKRVIAAREFFDARIERTTVLEFDEMVTGIEVPVPKIDSKSNFSKYSLRKVIDFPIVNCAVAIAGQGGIIREAEICFNGVYNIPYNAVRASEYLKGRVLNESIADEASNKAWEDARPLRNNQYMVQISKTLLKRALMLI